MATPPPYASIGEEMEPPPGYTEETQPIYPQVPDYHQQPDYPQQHGYHQQPDYPQHHDMSAVHPAETTLLMQHCGESPFLTNCPYCQATIITAVHYDVGTFAWLMSGFIFFVGGWLGCFLIPCCIDGCKDVVHTCPKCDKQLCRWSRL